MLVFSIIKLMYNSLSNIIIYSGIFISCIIGASAYLHIVYYRIQYGGEKQSVPIPYLDYPLLYVEVKEFYPVCHLINYLRIA